MLARLVQFSGINRITIPEVPIGPAALRRVTFTTRPDDDVFSGSDVEVKLGSHAYAGRRLMLDYSNGC